MMNKLNIKQLKRSEITSTGSNSLVALFPSRESGVDFIKENNSWGFVNIAREPEYVGIYISGDAKEIRYFAQVKDIIPAEEATLTQSVEEYEDYQSGRKVIVFEDNSVYKLENPIPFSNRVLYPPVRYTNLQTSKTAVTMDDLF